MASPEPVRLDLREIDDWTTVRLTGAHADLLAASEAVSIRPDGRGVWQVKAAGWVGAAVLGDPGQVRIDLRVQPKVSIARLLFLMGYAQSPRAWSDDPIDTPEAADVPAAVAEALARLADRALRQGVLQGYRTVEESGTTLRGRLREKDQILRNYGAVLPVAVVYDEFGPDIAENRILKAALWRMLAVPGVPDLTRRRLVRLRHRLGEASDLPGGARLPTWTASRLNTRYQPALRLAELILRSSSFDLGRGRVPATGFLVGMPSVFEDFVTAALTVALTARGGGRCTAQDTGWHLDAGKEVTLRPDLVWYPAASRRDRTPGLVVDAKYKAERYSGFPNPDIYQLLAYCSALQLSEGHLVYAAGNEAGRDYRLPGTGPGGRGVTIRAHTVDLDQAPVDLLAQVNRLAARMLAPGSGTRGVEHA